VLKELLQHLSKRKSSDIVFNQYQDKNILNNLKLYFEWLLQNRHNVLLIGEAPGYRGCRLTGIPFTSGAIIKSARHKIFKEIGVQIKLHKVVSENTAAILWEILDESKPIPVLWNAFPFHPFKSGLPESNRKPTSSEIKEGKRYLEIVYEIFKPVKLCSLGRVGEAILDDLFPHEKVIYIRHPSHGGKKEFVRGMQMSIANR